MITRIWQDHTFTTAINHVGWLGFNGAFNTN